MPAGRSGVGLRRLYNVSLLCLIPADTDMTRVFGRRPNTRLLFPILLLFSPDLSRL